MSEQPYTPDEFNVRMAWVTTGIGPEDDLNAEFDRWLAEVQRAARAEGWAEGYDAGEECALTAEQNDHECVPNPYESEEARHDDA